MAAALRPSVLWDARDQVTGAPQGELASHRRLNAAIGEMRNQPVLGGIRPGEPAVERERDRVKNRGLARAGRAFEQKQAPAREPVEIDPLRRGERPERLQLESVQ